jgi:hypothetical protein
METKPVTVIARKTPEVGGESSVSISCAGLPAAFGETDFIRNGTRYREVQDVTESVA